MVTIPLGKSVFKRVLGRAPEIELVNRFLEENPANLVEGTSLLARPGTSLLTNVGTGTPRNLFTQPGAFNGDLFALIGNQLHRYQPDGTIIDISGFVAGSGAGSMTVTAGEGFQHLFIADGQSLQVYTGEGAANATLTLSPSGAPPDIVDGDTVQIGAIYYEWTSGSVDTGTPDGTQTDPWLIALGSDDAESLDRLVLAVNATGEPGVDYSTALTGSHPDVTASSLSDTEVQVEAKEAGTGGNSIQVSETGANLSWGQSTLSGGGTHVLQGVATPDDVGIVSVATISSFVLAAVQKSQRFYWIVPGELTIEPLNFASAESEPDEIISIREIGDQAWIFGQSSTEVWYASGQAQTPFLRVQGQAFNQGIVGGTDAAVRDRLFFVGEDDNVYFVSGSPRVVSNPWISERIRRARS